MGRNTYHIGGGYSLGYMFVTGLFCFVSIFRAEIQKHRVECSFVSIILYSLYLEYDSSHFPFPSR